MNPKFLFYLRYFLIIPASILGACLGQLLAILVSWINSVPDWATHLIGSTTMGLGFVLSGIYASPKRTSLVAYALLFIYITFSIFIFVYSIYNNYEYNIYLLILNVIGGILGAFYATTIVKE